MKNIVISKLNNSKFIQKKYLGIFVISAFAFWTFPSVLNPATGGLGPSWDIALHMAKIDGLVWGDDIAMTYGPLGYLQRPINIDQELWIHTFYYKTISHILFFVTFGLFFYKTSFSIKYLITFGIFSVIFTAFGMYYLFIGLILGWYLYLKYSQKLLFLIPLTFASSFYFFVKGDVLLGALSVFVSSLIILAIQKRWKEFSISSFLYLLFLVIIWASMKYPLSEFFSYVDTMFSIQSGYAIAMSIDKLIYPGYLAIPLWSLFFILLFVSFKKKYDLKIFFISAGPLFLFYKLGIVREDAGHSIYFFLLWPVIIFIYLIIFRDKLSSKLKFVLISFIVSFILIALITIYIPFPLISSDDNSNPTIDTIVFVNERIFDLYSKSHVTKLPNYISFIVDDNNFEHIRISEKEKIREYYSQIPITMINKIENHTVDVIPWDNAILYAHDLNWKPRLVLQSYSAYTAKLDSLDAQFLASEESPQFLLYEWKSIDSRFPAFTAPESLRTVMCNYHSVEVLKRVVLLEKNEQNTCSFLMPISSQETTFGKKVIVPNLIEGDYLFAKIHIKQNILGKISDLFYKSPHVRIQLNDNVFGYRFIYPTAENGILLSANPDVANISLGYNITKFEFKTEYENFFEKEIKIEFFEIKIV